VPLRQSLDDGEVMSANYAGCRVTSAFDRFSDIGGVRSVRLGRSSDISALSADIAQDEWQIAPQTLDVGYATSEPCLCASFAVTGEVTGN
jgi:hypothetical protein